LLEWNVMEIRETKNGDVVILELKGRLDSSTLREIEQKLPSLILSGERRILLDFSELDYISSAGLRILILAAKQLHNSEGRIVICSMKDYIKEVFDISGFSNFFPIHRSQVEAMRDFPAP
jgi:anti-sigma B factor antagonist